MMNARHCILERVPNPRDDGRRWLSKKVCYDIGCLIQDEEMKPAIYECKENGCQDVPTAGANREV